MDLFIMQICILISNVNLIRTKSLNAEIEEFINRLLNSDKFDELADKIAEKAAWKIFDLDNIRISHNIKTPDEDPPSRTKHKSLRERGEGYNYLQAKEENQPLNTEIIEIKQNPIKPHVNQKNELNIKQKLNKDISSSKEQLPLKFKNLKASRGNIYKQQNILNSKNDNNEMLKRTIELIKPESLSKTKNDKQHKSSFERVNNRYKSPKYLKQKYKSDMSLEEIKYIHGDKYEEIIENRSGDDNKKSYADKGFEEKDRSNDIETSEKNVDNSTDSNEYKHDHNIDSNERNETTQNQTFSIEINNDGPSKEKRISNEDLVSKMDNRNDLYEMEKYSNEKNLTDIRKRYSINTSLTTRRLIIRREGDKLFAFENSPDYQEYEEKIASQKVEVKETAL